MECSRRPGLRSADTADYVKHRLQSKFGERCFSYAGPAAWNSLPHSIKLITDTSRFKQLLKSHLFCIAFWHFVSAPGQYVSRALQVRIYSICIYIRVFAYIFSVIPLRVQATHHPSPSPPHHRPSLLVIRSLLRPQLIDAVCLSVRVVLISSHDTGPAAGLLVYMSRSRRPPRVVVAPTDVHYTARHWVVLYEVRCGVVCGVCVNCWVTSYDIISTQWLFQNQWWALVAKKFLN